MLPGQETTLIHKSGSGGVSKIGVLASGTIVTLMHSLLCKSSIFFKLSDHNTRFRGDTRLGMANKTTLGRLLVVRYGSARARVVQSDSDGQRCCTLVLQALTSFGSYGSGVAFDLSLLVDRGRQDTGQIGCSCSGIVGLQSR